MTPINRELWPLVSDIENLFTVRSRLLLHLIDRVKTLGDNKRGLATLLLQQRIRTDRCPVNKEIDQIRSNPTLNDLSQALNNCLLWLGRCGRDLERLQSA